jgi:chromosome segregation ATPase
VFHNRRFRWLMSISESVLIAGMLVASPARGADSDLDQDKFQIASRAQNYARDLAAYNAAKDRYDQAVAEIVNQRRAAGEDFRSSSEYKAAEKAVDDTFRAYNDRKKQVTGDIRKTDPRYAELKKQADAVDAEIAAARQTPGVTIQQFNDLYNRKAVFTREIRALEDDAIDKNGSTQLKQQWDAASQQFAELQSKQRQVVENADRVKVALVRASEAKAALDEAGAALAGSKAAYAEASALQSQADEYLRRYPPSNDWGCDRTSAARD